MARSEPRNERTVPATYQGGHLKRMVEALQAKAIAVAIWEPSAIEAFRRQLASLRQQLDIYEKVFEEQATAPKPEPRPPASLGAWDRRSGPQRYQVPEWDRRPAHDADAAVDALERDLLGTAPSKRIRLPVAGDP